MPIYPGACQSLVK